MMRKPTTKRGWMAWLMVPVTAVVFAATEVVVNRFGTDYRIGLDPQSLTCLPWRFYLMEKTLQGPIKRGQLVTFRSRGLTPHFPDGVKVTKLVAGIAGDRVRVADNSLWVNDVYWGDLWMTARLKASVRDFEREQVIQEGEIFVLGTAPGSYDGRYWGALRLDQVIGHATPIL